jgi:hypothetical protein
MLLPPPKRDTRFFVGRREYDPRHVGFVTTPDEDGDEDGFWLDTSIAGNHNTGHAFAADAATWAKHQQDPTANPLPNGVIGPEFTDDERYAIVEYLKVHRDLPETPAEQVGVLKQIRERERLPYDFVVTTDQTTQMLYGATSLPTAVLIDRKGVIRYIEAGTSSTRLEQMRQMVQKLVAEK